MKILFLSSHAHLVLDENSTLTSGGAELQVALLAQSLGRRGHEVVIAAGDTGQADRAVLQGVRVRNAGKFHTGRMPAMISSIPRVFSVLREERPDWVVVMGWTAWLFVLLLFRPLLGYKMDYICALDTEVNGEYRRAHPFLGGLFEFALRRCDARHAITRDQLEHYRRRGMEASFYRYLLVPRPPGDRPAKDTDFLWVSRCVAMKRPDVFLDLAEAMPARSFEMICPPQDRELYRRIAARAAALPNVRFFESVPYSKVQRHYDRARVFVNTSEWEGWPNSFIQAGLGRAALLSLAVNPDDIFGLYRPGFFAAGDLSALLSGAQNMISDTSGLEPLQEGCERFVREMHDSEKETDAFLRGLGAEGRQR
ncbi:MAG: glycosyltransferase family 4 protein [Chthoniobacterales bacterium]|jgi:glycosyltransferase involved in cell wall biosynthesis